MKPQIRYRRIGQVTYVATPPEFERNTVSQLMQVVNSLFRKRPTVLSQLAKANQKSFGNDRTIFIVSKLTVITR